MEVVRPGGVEYQSVRRVGRHDRGVAQRPNRQPLERCAVADRLRILDDEICRFFAIRVQEAQVLNRIYHYLSMSYLGFRPKRG
jgi:hypothetical protein